MKLSDQATQAEPLSEIDRLKDELHLLTSGGIIEVAIRNPSVFEYMAHWEGRTEEAEAKVQDQRALLDKAEAALAECEAELNAYYANEYAGDHPYSVKKLAQAKATNPASEAIAAIRSEGNE